MSRPEIRVSGLHKSFGDNHVLRGIDLEIGQGDVVCVIGPSGSGKSTLLRCVNLLEEPTEGQVFVGGIELTDPDVDIDAAQHLVVTEGLVQVADLDLCRGTHLTASWALASIRRTTKPSGIVISR